MNIIVETSIAERGTGDSKKRLLWFRRDTAGDVVKVAIIESGDIISIDVRSASLTLAVQAVTLNPSGS